MAAGDGGFSNQINGFNKNEVNEYIGKISKEKKELENDLKAAEDKIKAAEKRASEAEAKINSSKEESDKQIAELTAQVKEERKKSEEYINQIDDLKRKLKNGGKISSDPNADKQAAEIIAKAKAQAAQIIEDAKKNAPSSSVPSIDTAAFTTAFNSFKNAVTNEMQKFSSKAGEILKTPVSGMGGSGSYDNSSASLFENMDDGMDTGMGSTDVTAASDLDMSGMSDMMDAVSEVAPLDDPEKPQHEMVDSFDNELLAQTVPTAVSDTDMFNAVSDVDVGGVDGPVGFDMGSETDDAQSDLDAMNALLGQMSASLESAGGSAMGSMDDMNDMGSMHSFNEPASETPKEDNPWANLQAQLDAMEKSGDYGSDEQGNEPQPDITNDVQEAPSADDSSIWNFGGDSSSGSDDDMNDDMSADLFGSF